ncbi:DnaJ C-terminal domain-containing protein [Gulosibacter sp. 10]|uniref:DnaJ C-terminal domain-containing protein n=1 Tax=Gulosibacter sp. 10 TaxID=1255570 RepID=UPI00097E8631|nr:DnaJ C-terminal domain-containing protein [Gulosibacter sp. 10]SJM54873.1 Chaperone protein DnaJ [Gulosibacter sp. 10]
MASQDWFEKDFYQTLGVDKDVSEGDLKKTYRKLARKYHPDSNPGDTAAEEKFKEVSEAYDVLSDPETRKEYDQIRAMGSGARFAAGSGGPGGASGFEDLFGGMFGQGGGYSSAGRGGGFPGGYEDLFGGMFGGGAGFQRGPQKGADQRASTTLSFMTAIRGDTIDLQAGDGRVITARIPAGVRDGQKIRLRGKGQPSPNGGEPGDLILEVSVRPHPVFSRDGDNIEIAVPITFAEAVKGARIEVPTIDGGTVKLKVPPFSQSGKRMRVKGRGVETKKHKGDMVVRLEVVVPSRLTREQEEALDAFIAASPADDPREDLLREARS